MITRERARELVDHKYFQWFIMAVIVINAVTLGMETAPNLGAHTGGLPTLAARVALAIFVVELLLRLYAYGWRFFTDSWNVFDLVIVGIALVPAAGPFIVVRALRVLRALRLMSAIPAMRRAVSALLSAVPGMASVAALLALVLRAEVAALRAEHFPEPG